MFNLHVCLCWHLAPWPLGVFRCWRLPRNTHRCLRAIYMRSINPPKIEDLSRSTTLMQGIASLKLFIQFQTGDWLRILRRPPSFTVIRVQVSGAVRRCRGRRFYAQPAGTAARHGAASSPADQTPDQAFGLPEVLVAVSTSRLSCKRAGKTRTLMPVWDSYGESRFRREQLQGAST